VVPTYLTPGNLMIVGEFPNCRFATVTAPGASTLEKQVAVGDINEPFTSGRYFDGYSVRDYPTGAVLREHYVDPLGLKLETDIWLTNLVKCFLFKADQVDVYNRLGWNDPAAPSVQSTHEHYADVAEVCLRENLVHEIDLCQPKLILALGYNVFHAFHPDHHDHWNDMLGLPLRGDMPNKRLPPFDMYPIVHLYHPSYLLREGASHLAEHAGHMEKAASFAAELGVAPQPTH
jgi:uracil-DNA glycosylase